MKVKFPLSVVLASLLAIGCTQVHVVETPPPVNYQKAARTALRLKLYCDGELEGYGSATAIGPFSAITAAHVQCDDPAQESTYEALLIGGGVVHMVKGEEAADDVDALLLWSEGGKFGEWAGIATEDPLWGEHVFGVTGDGGFDGEGGFPAFYLKHGWVAEVEWNKVSVSQHCVPGNSGSGWFNERGEIVGVLSAGVWAPGSENWCEGYRPVSWLSLIAP